MKIFILYGLFEDVDMSMRVGRTHKLVCRLDATITHDDSLGQTTRPSDTKYFLASWINSAYIIEKLFPTQESRSSHRRFFNLIKLRSKVSFKNLGDRKIKTLGDEQLIAVADNYISALQNCRDRKELENVFLRFREQISNIPPKKAI